MESKVCNKCLEEKPLESFYKNSKGKYGRSQSCNKCSRKISKKWREGNLHKVFATKYNTDEGTIKNILSIDYCEVCGTREGRLVIDHCHTSGSIRGRLCSNCNVAIGLLGDDTAVIKNVLDYLRNKREYGS